MPIKQVIVIRMKFPDEKGELRKIRTGKLCSQAAHASMKVFFDDAKINHGFPASMEISMTSDMLEWVMGSFAKIVVYVDSEKELLDLHKKAQDVNLPCAIIQDSGKTEFGGVPTYTSLAIGPAKSELIDPITGHLPLC